MIVYNKNIFNPFETRCQYTDQLFQLEITALYNQMHDLLDDVLTYRHIVNTLTPRPSGFERNWCQGFVF